MPATMSSRQRMLAALRRQEPDHVPCSFMIFGAVRALSRDYAETIERQVAMGLDTFVQIPIRPPLWENDYRSLYGMPVSYDPSVRVIPLRCLGSLNIVWIADALSSGIDGVMLVGCKYGDDYQCHFAKGSELANQRLENVKETLQRLQLESTRIQLTQLAINEYDKLPVMINEFMDRIREIGPNPYMGF